MGESKRHVPVRTCISCGTKRGKKELIRMTLDAHGLLVRDDNGKGQGRGAYVCPRRSCWDSIGKSHRLSRAFRRKSPITFHSGFRFE